MNETDSTISLKSSRFGDLEIPQSKLIKVPEGIIGFPDSRLYALLDPSAGDSVFLWLQAADDPDLAFIITNPLEFILDYTVDKSEPDIQRLDIAGKPPPALFVIITVPRNDPDNVTANLLAPLLYFENENILYQIVMEKADWPLRHKLLPHDDSETDEPPDETEQAGGDA